MLKSGKNSSINNDEQYNNSTLNIRNNENDKKSIQNIKTEMVGNNAINNEIKSIKNSSMKKEFKRIINEDNINKEDIMEFFKMYFNLNNLKILEKSLKENSQYNNHIKGNNIYNVYENKSIELNSNEMIDNRSINLNLNEETITVINDNFIKVNLNRKENYPKWKRKWVIYINDTFDIDLDKYSEDEVEFVELYDEKDEELPPNYREVLFTSGPIRGVLDDGSGSKLFNKKREPEKFLNNKASKFDVVTKLLDIRDSNRRECKEYARPAIYSTAVDRFDLMCSYYDNEELKQLRRASELKDLLYNEYKNGGYYYIERFVKLFDK